MHDGDIVLVIRDLPADALHIRRQAFSGKVVSQEKERRALGRRKAQPEGRSARSAGIVMSHSAVEAQINRPWLHRLLRPLRPSENTWLISLAILLGVASGLGATGFHLLIETTHRLAFEWAPQSGPAAHMLRTLLAPALGGLAAGLLIWILARHDHGHGTSSVMEAVALRGGRLAARPILTKVVAAGVLIGAGGSAGPEDPSVQIGSVFGSSLGRRLRLSDRLVKTLVAAGVASAIAAAFNAPVAGVFFALEIVAGEFSTTLFAPVVLAAVAASVVSRALLGAQPAFRVPAYEVVNPVLEAPLYALLGVITAIGGALFIRTVFAAEHVFEHTRLRLPVRALLGGLCVGAIGLAVPGALGVGYDVASEILIGQGPVGASLTLLLAAKFLATGITLGAAEVGGTFAPSMVMGAMLGGLFGQAVNAMLPGMTAPPAAYALVGMGALLTAVVRAPITAVLLLFEVTGDYRIILMIMASVVVSELFAHRLHPESIYTERLVRAGMNLRFGRDLNILELVTVGEAMTPDFTTVPGSMTIADLDALFDRTRHHGFPVLDGDGRLEGIVTLSDLERAVEQELALSTTAGEIATRALHVVHPDQSLNEALRIFGQVDVGRLPVVDRDDPRRLRGVLRRSDIVKAYSRGTMRRGELEQRLAQMRASSQSGAHLVEILVSQGSAVEGRAIRELDLPSPAVVSTIHRDGHVLLAHRDTRIRAGDRVMVMSSPENVATIKAHFSAATADATALHYRELVLPASTPAAGRAVAELELPREALIIALRRAGHIQTVHGSTRLAGGDELTILASDTDLAAIRACLLA